MGLSSRPRQRQLPAALLVALAALLLASCGAASPSTTAPSAPNADSASSEFQRGPTGADAPADAQAEIAPAAEPPAPAMLESREGVVLESGAPKENAGGIGAAQPTMAPPEMQPPVSDSDIVGQQQSGTPLRAGEVNDNLDYATYQSYLSSFYSPPGRAADISERYILTVTDAQQRPILDASVRIYDGSRAVYEARTYAGGQAIFLPRTLPQPPTGETLRVEIAKGNSSASGELHRGQDGTASFILAGAEPLPEQPRLDVLFLLDATGSMGDEINQVQRTILSIAQRIDGFKPRPALRFGLVAYRDYGDEYVTRVYDFTPDVTAFQKLLESVRADGGGDEPEALDEGLQAALQQVRWADDAVRLTFLVADAPPHISETSNYTYLNAIRDAQAQGVKIYPIAASNTSSDAEYVFRQLAQQTLASFIFLTYQEGQSAGAPGDSTTHQIDPESFTVERLDDLVVQVIQRELTRAIGVG